MKKLLIPAFALLAWFGYKHAMDMYKKVGFDFISVKLKSYDTEKINVVARFAIINPTPAFLSFTGLRSDILYKKSLLSKFNISRDVSIKANGNTVLSIPLVIPIDSFTTGAANAIMDMFTNYRLPVIRMVGRIDFKYGGVNFDLSQKLEA